MKTIRTRLIISAALAWIGLAAGACTTTYSQAQLDADEPLAESIPDEAPCGGLYGEPGCQVDSPMCSDPGDFDCPLVED